MNRILQGLFLVCLALRADGARIQKKQLNQSLGGGVAIWEQAWSDEIIHLHGQAAHDFKTSIDESDPNWDPFPSDSEVPAEAHQTTMLQMLGTRHAEDWTGLVLQGKSFWQKCSVAHMMTQWTDMATPACEEVFAGHTQDDKHEEIFKNHCHAITGHHANHGIGVVLQDIIRLGHVHLSLRAIASPGVVAENHWFGVLAPNDHKRQAWLSNHGGDICQLKGDHVLVLPLESTEMKAYMVAIHDQKQAFPENIDHVSEDGIVHDMLDSLPTHNMVGRLVFRYSCHSSDGYRPRVSQISLLIQD